MVYNKFMDKSELKEILYVLTLDELVYMDLLVDKVIADRRNEINSQVVEFHQSKIKERWDTRTS